MDEKYPNRDIVVIFSQYFLSNPDLVSRIKECLGLIHYDGKSFSVYESPSGYSDYPFSKEWLSVGQ